VVGLCGLMFKVMPYLGPVEISAVLAVIPAIPAVIHTISVACKRVTLRKCRSLKIILSGLAAILLIAGIIVVCVLNAGKTEDKTSDIELIVWTIVSCLTLSLRWVETYIATDQEKPENRYRNIQVSTSKGASVNHFISSIFRVIVATILYAQYFCKGIRDPDFTFKAFIKLTDESANESFPIQSTACPNGSSCAQPYQYLVWLPWDVLPSFLIHILTAVAVYHCAVVACRLCMQRVCFTIPLSIASPIYVVVALATIEADVDWVKTMFLGTRPEPSNSIFFSLAVFLVAWLFQLVICRQAWTEPQERLQFVQK